MSLFENLGLCHNTEGVAPDFAAHVCLDKRRVNASDVHNEKNAPSLSASEMLMIVMLAKQLLENRD